MEDIERQITFTSDVTEFHKFLRYNIFREIYEAEPECCPYCCPYECEKHLSPAVKFYLNQGGLDRDLHKYFGEKYVTNLKDLLGKQRSVMQMCPKYKGVSLCPLHVVSVNMSCSASISARDHVANELIRRNTTLPIGTPVLYLEYDIRPINHELFNVLEDVRWIPYGKWSKQSDYEDRTLNSLLVLRKLWDTAEEWQVSQFEEILYQPTKLLEYHPAVCAQ